MDTQRLTEASRAALAQLRDPTTFHWSMVCILAIAGFLVFSELEAGRTNVVAAGATIWLADWINEILNSGIMHWTGRAPLWAETGRTSYMILVGLNIESSVMFLIYGMAYAKLLPKDPRRKILGLNNRIVFSLIASAFSVGMELNLNYYGVLHWYWPFWNKPYGLPVIFVLGYVWFFLAAGWAYDAQTEGARWRRVGAFGATAVVLAAVFAPLGWL